MHGTLSMPYTCQSLSPGSFGSYQGAVTSGTDTWGGILPKGTQSERLRWDVPDEAPSLFVPTARPVGVNAIDVRRRSDASAATRCHLVWPFSTHDRSRGRLAMEHRRVAMSKIGAVTIASPFVDAAAANKG
jgi:hypothetical protein